MAKAYSVVGAETGVWPRLEIRDLQKNRIQFSLYIRALNKILADKNLTNPISWWQIGAIHGLPYKQWSGDPNGPKTADPNSPYGGYCYHGSALFPTWHRVLVLLVEQAVVRTAIDIATGLEDANPIAANEKWVQAAKELRQPYWDWTLKETIDEGIPKLLQDPKVLIAQPGDFPIKDIVVANPLNHYRYADPDGPGTVTGVEYMGKWKRTYRWIRDGDDPRDEQYDQAQKAFASGTTLYFDGHKAILDSVETLRGKVSALFQYPLTLEEPSYSPNLWGYFSNTAAHREPNLVYRPKDLPESLSSASIEEPHNKVHLDIGGKGSMSWNEYAAFDPIFYLHHTNIDRIYAFWEYVYPNYWIEDGWKDKNGETVTFKNGQDGNYQQDPYAPIRDSTELLPFRDNCEDPKYWTSNDVRGLLSTNPKEKYYTYPPIKEVNVNVPYDTSDEELREKYRRILFNEWSPKLVETFEEVKKLSADSGWDLLLEKNESGVAYGLHHLVVQAQLPEFAFTGSYRLELYIRSGNTPRSPVYVLNSTSVFGRADPDKCDACKDRRAAGSRIRGYMPLDPRVVFYILAQRKLPPSSITELTKLREVVRESLQARLVRPDGRILADVAEFKLGTELETEKAPDVSLYSQVITFDDAVVPGAAPVVKFRHHASHGSLGDKTRWRAY